VTSTARPLSEVLKDIFDNLQDIIRSEAKLAKAELREELEKVKVKLAWIAVAAVAGFFAFAYLLLSGFFALRYALTPWAAAAIIALILAAVCGLSLVLGLKRGATTAPATASSTIQKESELGRNHS
jgi:ABC-type proline/glycine betaine transport system permease subunit